MDSVYKPPRPSGFVKFLPESFSTHKFGSALNWLHLHANRKKASKLTQAHNWKGSLIHWAADTCASTISAKTITCHWFKSTHSWSVELTCGQLFDVLSWNVNKCLTVSLTQEQVKKNCRAPNRVYPFSCNSKCMLNLVALKAVEFSAKIWTALLALALS